MNGRKYHRDFASDNVPARDVVVWLPPEYDAEHDRRFPVLYMHDGQNLFDEPSPYDGATWELEATLERLVSYRELPALIVVGVWNDGFRRWQEYMPQRPYDSEEGADFLDQQRQVLGFSGELFSDAYLRFLVDEVMPFVDGEYRTLRGAENTSVMGSSMGGLISLYAICEYPAVFGSAACLSTHWPAVRGVINQYLASSLPAPTNHRIYFDYGTETLDSEYEPFQMEVDELMKKRGFSRDDNWITLSFDGAPHTAGAWRDRVEIPLKFLYRANG